MSKVQTKTSSKTVNNDLSLQSIADSFLNAYKRTPVKLKVLDLYAAIALLTAFLQFVYAILVGTFPFNAFLAGFFCCIGAFVLTVSLRMQITQDGTLKESPERAFVDYVLAMTVLFLAVWCYIG